MGGVVVMDLDGARGALEGAVAGGAGAELDERGDAENEGLGFGLGDAGFQ